MTVVYALLLSVLCLGASAEKPNIVMVLADDYGWADIGYHGSDIKTPVLDGLAAAGVKLENYYVQQLCSPSRAALLTGRYPIHTGLQHLTVTPASTATIPVELPTLADKLRDAGYSTHMVGKWHLGYAKTEYTPTQRGFDSFYGYYLGGGDHFNHTSCIRDVCATDLNDHVGDEHNVAWGVTEYSTNLFTHKAEDVITKHDQNKPLFLYVGLQTLHTPLQVPEKYEKDYENIEDESRRTYAGMAACMDEAMGNLTSSLKAAGMWDNTVFVFSTDNGGGANAGASNIPLAGNKGSFWEGGIRGVGFVSGGLVKPRVSNELMHIADWYPTFVHLAGGDTADQELDAVDMWDSISAGTASPRVEILHNIDPLATLTGENLYPKLFDVRVQAAIRHKGWKLLTGNPGRNPGNPGGRRTNVRLYNLDTDPNETTELSKSQPEMVVFLLERLASYNSTAVTPNYPDTDRRAFRKAREAGAFLPWL